MDKALKNKSRSMTKILRHDPSGLAMNKQGYVKITDLLQHLKMDIKEMLEIVKDNNKDRFKIDETKTLIRASQGHSIPDLDLGLEKVRPLFPLYHGTAGKNKEIIFETGVKKMGREHVHLSQDTETALNVAGRHCKKGDKPIIFELDVRHMYADKVDFYLSENNVWLTDYVDPKYLTLLP